MAGRKTSIISKAVMQIPPTAIKTIVFANGSRIRVKIIRNGKMIAYAAILTYAVDDVVNNNIISIAIAVVPLRNDR